MSIPFRTSYSPSQPRPPSVAALMLTTEALVADIREDDKKPAAPGGMGGMY